MWSVASDPADGDTGVDRQGRITIKLGRLPLPTSVVRTNMTLRSGSVESWLDPRLQPLRRELWITARGALEPETRYEFELRGLTDLDGVALPKSYRILFETGTQLGRLEPEPSVDALGLQELLVERCARSGCHASQDPAAGLDLETASGIEATARNIGTQRSRNTPGLPPRGSLSLAAPLIIDANARRGDPSRSYLVYKLLGDEHSVGDAMPPAPEPRLDDDDIQRIIDWIYAGAPTQ